MKGSAVYNRRYPFIFRLPRGNPSIENNITLRKALSIPRVALPPANCFLRHGFPLCTRPPLRVAWSGSALYHGACIHPFRPIVPQVGTWARRSRTAQGALTEKRGFRWRVFSLLYLSATAFIIKMQVDFFVLTQAPPCSRTAPREGTPLQR